MKIIYSLYNKYPYVFILVILFALGVFAFGLQHLIMKEKISDTNSNPSTKVTDTTIAQYNERPSASVSPSETAPLTPGCGLQFSFAPVSKAVAPGAEVTYAITVRNGGTETCHNVSFSLYYSNNEAFVSADPNPTSSNYYWSIGDLSSNKEYKTTVITRQQSADDSSQISNEACATADNSKDVCPENVIFVGTSGEGVSQNASAPEAVGAVAHVSGELGVWVWQSPLQMASGYPASMIASLKENNFNAVYITIDDYLDIAALPEGAEKTAEKNNYMKALSNIINMASKAGIAVDVEGGAKDWGESANRYKGYALVDFVGEYNKAYPSAKVRALQYDVEPYLLPQYDSDPSSVLSDYLAFIDASVERMKNVDASLSVVIPHFYDSAQKWTPEISYDGKSEYPFTHLLEILEKKPGSTLTIMAYRNFFSGDDGVSDISLPEIKEASAGQYSTKIIIAQETGNVTPAYVTFHGESRQDLFSVLSAIEDSFRSYANFGGVAVHYLDPFLQLK